jgi:hypothetical protein
MARKFINLFLTALARALIAHSCGEIVRVVIQYFVPGASSLACVVLGLTVGVVLVEIATTYWRRAAGPSK